MEAVSFDLAKKLKEKGFIIPTKDIIGMYNELGVFHTLTTSADYEKCADGTKYRCYYDYEDFDEYDYIAPTISQVLKWLREEKNIHINIDFYSDKISDNEYTYWSYRIIDMNNGKIIYKFDNKQCMLEFESYEEVAITGVEYVLNNLI